MKLSLADLQQHVRIRLETERGGFIYDPDLGSELWRLQRAKNVAGVRNLAEQYIRQALKPEIDAKLIDDVDQVQISELTQTTFKISVVVRAGGQKVSSVFDGITGRIIPDEVVGC
jgi:phage gp46-like protein